MGEQRYRFGGPIPESVQRLKSRREYRASSLYARIKKNRRERVDEARAAVKASHSLSGKDWHREALEPFVRHVAPAVSAGAAGSDRSATASGRGIPR